VSRSSGCFVSDKYIIADFKCIENNLPDILADSYGCPRPSKERIFDLQNPFADSAFPGMYYKDPFADSAFPGMYYKDPFADSAFPGM